MEVANIFPYIVVYTCAWWILFYLALPIGISRAKNVAKGHADSAPDKTWLMHKFIIVTIISIPISWVIRYIIDHA